ncbi:MAG: HIT family protein [Thiobacillaceae bacterium]|nr:HIT family protein [Thiobacillaceae bacterium]MCX7672329.1 HIT family protein [Thiobacillaceae bacterium]MDW8323945.1 HIT family protein [Burkholderiales bacterium]
MSLSPADCPLCAGPGGETVWRDALCRVVWIDEPDYPGYCRVILNEHVREMTDLPEEERHRLMRVVFAVEAALRELMQPDKVNLASLGNQVPHLHWHVIPRYRADRHYPDPVWAPPRRPPRPMSVDAADLKQRLARAVAVLLAPPE